MLRRTSRTARTGRVADLLAVGLGNPGAEYAATRHNVGADAIEVLAARHGVSLRAERGLSARVGEATVGASRLALGVPTTFMNDSGVALSPLVRRYIDSDLSHLVVVHDELDFPVGKVAVKVGGGTAGHNGLRSAEAHLRSLSFVRVRIGIGKAPGQMSGRDHVLRRPSGEERDVLQEAVERAANAVELILSEGPNAAMTTFNVR